MLWATTQPLRPGEDAQRRPGAAHRIAAGDRNLAACPRARHRPCGQRRCSGAHLGRPRFAPRRSRRSHCRSPGLGWPLRRTQRRSDLYRWLHRRPLAPEAIHPRNPHQRSSRLCVRRSTARRTRSPAERNPVVPRRRKPARRTSCGSAAATASKCRYVDLLATARLPLSL